MRFRVSVVVVSLAIAVGARSLTPDRAISQYAHRAWRMEDGLPNSVVRGILQTGDGYVWIATYEGLARFNGHSFARFDKNNLKALKRDTVLAFIKSGDETLWIGTNGGGVGWLRNGVARVLTTKEGLPSDIVAALAEGSDGTIWIGTSAGLCAWRAGHLERTVVDTSILSLAVQSDGSLWLGTRGSGVLVLRNGVAAPASDDVALSTASVYALLTDADGSVWAGTNQGLVRFPRKGAVERIRGIPEEQVTALLRDSDGTLWAGTYSNGLYRLAGGEIASFTTAQGLLNNSVRSLFEDVEKNLWVGTNGGVECLTRGKFITVGTQEGLSDPYARSVFEDREGGIWIGTAHGLTRIRGDETTTFTTKDGLSNDYILSIAQAPDGAIWLGTPTGLNRLAGGAVRTFTEEDGLPSRSVRALLFDRRGVLWIGTDRGLARRSNDRFELVVPGPRWESAFVQTFAEGPDGSVWIGTDGRGIARWHEGRISVWSDREGLPDTHVLTIHADAAGTVWMGTDSAGLIRMKGGRFTRYTTASGLWSDKVLQMLDDSRGRLWFGGGRGIWSVSARELDEVAEGKRKRVSSAVYGAGDGVRSVECNGSVYPSAMRSRDGRLWFSTVDGVATIAPRDALVRNLRPPPVRIEAVTVDGLTTLNPKTLIVKPGAQRIEIAYSALTYVAPQRVQFRIRLEGFDHGWIDPGNRRIAFYTGLPPGRYHFRVMAANSDGIWSREAASLPLEIEPRFFQTIWFPLLLLALVVTLVWLFQQRRVYVMRRREAQLVQMVSERTADIESALVEAEAANRAKSIFLANVSHELRTPLNAIIGFASVMLRDGETSFSERHLRFLNNISVSGEHLLVLINDILDLAKVEAGKMTLELERVSLSETFDGIVRVLKGITIARGIEITIELQDGTDVVGADAVKLKQIIYNLASNAVKFSPDGSAIRMRAERIPAAASPLGRDSIAISVIDEGIGIAPEHQQVIFDEFHQVHVADQKRPAGTGLGLTLVRRFVELHEGAVRVQSSLGVGSTFTVYLPFIESSEDRTVGFGTSADMVPADRE